MRHLRSILAVLGTAFLIPSLVGPASADGVAPVPPLKTFRDWVVGCDNIRRCTALGFASGPFEGYIVVKREGSAEAAAHLALVVRGSTAIAAPAVMSVQVDGAPVAGLSQAQLPFDIDREDTENRSGRSEMTGGDAALVLKQLIEGKVLTLTVTGKGQDPFDTIISLAGSSASLLYADDIQLRTGTVTALVEPGTEPASRIPAPPPIPYLNAVTLRDVEHPPKALPHGVKKPPADNCEDPPPPDVIRLSPTLDLWGVCEFKNSHNYSGRYWIVGEGQVREASLTVPGHRDPGGSPSVIINLELYRDPRLLRSVLKGRGLGDCGAVTFWIWTGTVFEVAQYSEMSVCQGASAGDWPVLYTTRLK